MVVNPMQTDKGVDAPVASEVQKAEKGVGSNELGTGYEEGSEGSIGHVPKYPEIVVPNAPRETHVLSLPSSFHLSHALERLICFHQRI